MVDVLKHGNISILRDSNSGKVTWQLQWHKKHYRFISFTDVNEKNLEEMEKRAIDDLLRDTAYDVGMFKEDLDGLYKQQSSLQNAVV